MADVDARLDETYRKAARAVADDAMRVIREPELDTRPVDLKAYPHVDQRFFARATEALAGHGFSVLRDLDARPLVGEGAKPPALRVLGDLDGETAAAVYHAIPKRPGWIVFIVLWLLRKWVEPRVVELTTYFDDGTAVTTTNLDESLTYFEAPPWVARASLGAQTSVDDLVAAHQGRVAARVASDAVVTRFADFEALDALRRAHVERTRAWRREVGGLLPVELDRMLKDQGAHAAPLRAHIEREVNARVAVMR